MQSITAYLDITKVDDFQQKNPDVSKTQGVCHVIFLFFGSSLDKFHFMIRVTDFREGDLFAPPIREQPQKGLS